MIEGESTFEPQDKETKIDGVEGAPKVELSPEQEQVLDQKREQLLQNDDLCLRFVYHKEYQDLIGRGETNDINECIMERFVNLPCQDKGGWSSNSPRLDREYNRPIPGYVNVAWAEIADAMTNWHDSSQALDSEERFFSQYRKFYEQCRSQGQGRMEARAMFADYLKGKTLDFVLLGYGVAKEHQKTSVEEKTQSAADLLSKTNENIPDEDRVRLKALFQQESAKYNKSDIRFLMRYAKGRMAKEYGNLPYGVLEVWSPDVATGRGYLEEFKLIPKGTRTDKLLAVVAISPSDKEFLEETARRMASATKDNSQSAHLIIDARLFESYPQRGTDFLAKK